LRVGEARLPWGEPMFSGRMLREHLDDSHDMASRRSTTVDAHVDWLAALVTPGRVLDLGCGPGLYLERLSARGWDGVGLDVSPASIEHARARASSSRSRCEYLLGDFRDAQVPGTFGLVLCLFGELSTVPLTDVGTVCSRIATWLVPDGRAVLEVSTRGGVIRKGLKAPSWYSTVGGLFADGEHAVLRESAWFDEHAASVERWWVLDPSRPAPDLLGSTTWWHGGALDELLALHGLTVESRYGDLTGTAPREDDDFEVLIVKAA